MSNLVGRSKAAQLLGVSIYTIPHLRRIGLPYVRLGKRKILYDPTDLQSYIEARKVNHQARAQD